MKWDDSSLGVGAERAVPGVWGAARLLNCFAKRLLFCKMYSASALILYTLFYGFTSCREGQVPLLIVEALLAPEPSAGANHLCGLETLFFQEEKSKAKFWSQHCILFSHPPPRGFTERRPFRDNLMFCFQGREKKPFSFVSSSPLSSVLKSYTGGG